MFWVYFEFAEKQLPVTQRYGDTQLLERPRLQPSRRFKSELSFSGTLCRLGHFTTTAIRGQRLPVSPPSWVPVLPPGSPSVTEKSECDQLVLRLAAVCLTRWHLTGDGGGAGGSRGRQPHYLTPAFTFLQLTIALS